MLATLCLLLLQAPSQGHQLETQRPFRPVPRLTTERVVGGLFEPVWVGAPSGDVRLFVVQKPGRVSIVEDGQVLDPPFLDIQGQVASMGALERGLLGMAFHPQYATNGRFFLNYTRLDGATVVSGWETRSANPDQADPNSEQIVLVQAQPFANHNGGTLQFGPDGYLYVAFGDGGGPLDPFCSAPDLSTWLGKLLRIDVDGTSPYAVPPGNPYLGTSGALPEIWFSGLRNPWRFYFDGTTGDVYIGDVGFHEREEIDFELAGIGGTDFGWPRMEGGACNANGGLGECPPDLPPCFSSAYRAPILDLANTPGKAVIAGPVYRGHAIDGLDGTSFYGTWADRRIHSFLFDPGSGTVHEHQDRTEELVPRGGWDIGRVSSFGLDGLGEVLILDYDGGEVFRIVPR